MSDLIKRSEVWQALHNIGGCGADPDSWADGWDKAIDAAIEAVEKLPSAETAQAKTGSERRAVRVEEINALTELEQVNVLNCNICAHGADFEAGIAMEECAELIQAISKVRRYGLISEYKANLIEEIADVSIVTHELALMYGLSDKDIAKEIDRKIKRIKRRLADKEKEDI